MQKNIGTIAERIKNFRASCPGIGTQQAFAAALGIDQQRLSGYEHGTRVPAQVIAALVTLGANPYWLLFGEGQMRLGADAQQINQAEVKVINAGNSAYASNEMAEFYVLPLYADEVAAGDPREMRDHAVEGPAIIHRAWCPHPENTDYVRVSASGTSMEPTIPAGSIVTIDHTYANPEELIGKIVAIRKNDGGVTLKRLAKDERGTYIGLPDNPTPANLPITFEEGDTVLGQVLSVHARLY